MARSVYENPGPPTGRRPVPPSTIAKDRGAPAPESSGGDDGDLESLSVKDLRARAKDAGVEGYSKMKKNQLVKALS